MPNAPAPTNAKLVSVLLSISKSTRALLGLKLAEMGFHNGQDELLFVLEENTQITVTALSEKLSIRPSTVSKMMDRMVAKGFILRTTDTRDQRRTLAQITKIGLDAQKCLLTMREKLEAELIAAYPTDVETIVEALGVAEALIKIRLAKIR